MDDIDLFQLIVIVFLILILFYATTCLSRIERLSSNAEKFGSAIVYDVSVQTRQIVSELHSRMVDMQEVMNTLVQDVEELRKEVDLIDGKINDIRTDVSGLEINLNELDTDLSAVGHKVDLIYIEVEDNNS